ncbi:MAG: hypothetical protein ACYTGZ_19255 [Planctomycetota bacterium]|jgi:hypothetical protein
MANRLLVPMLVLLAGASGWWLRGVIDAPERSQRAATTPRTEIPDEPSRAAARTPESGDAPATAPTDSWDALLAPAPDGEDVQGRLRRVLGPSAGAAEQALPKLLERAAAAMDERRVRELLKLMLATGSPKLRAAVLEAMVSDDLGYDFSHRDDVFREMFSGTVDEDVGVAALRRLQWEIERGETSDGEVGAYAYLVGAAGLPEGVAYLRELLAEQPSDWNVRGLATRGLAATGDAAAFEEIAREESFDKSFIDAFLDGAGEEGWTTLERIATGDSTPQGVAAAIAKASVHRKRTESAALLEKLWHGGHRRPALEGCMSLREGTTTENEAEQLRDIVYAVVRNRDDSDNVRRAAFYVIEYSPVFQTERAQAVLADIVAGSEKEYWKSAARAGLRETEKRLHKTAAMKIR